MERNYQIPNYHDDLVVYKGKLGYVIATVNGFDAIRFSITNPTPTRDHVHCIEQAKVIVNQGITFRR